MIISCMVMASIVGFMLALVAAIFMGVILINIDRISDDKAFGGALLAFILVFGFFLYMGASATMITETHPIYSIGDSLGVEGSFVLGCGSINSVPVYLFYMDAGNGGYRLGHVEATYSVIYEDAPEHTGYITATYPSCEYPNGWDIHVPKGTIKREFNLDSS